MMNNKTVYDFYKKFGKSKCVEFLKENYVSSSNVCPTDKSFLYALTRVLDKVEKFNKSKSRPQVAEEFTKFWDSNFLFPEADVRKRGPHIKQNESLSFKSALVGEKIKNQNLTEKIIETELLLEKKDVDLKSKNKDSNLSTEKLKQVRLNLKRTAARETYANKKLKKLEACVSKQCCTDKANQIEYLESVLAEKDKEIKELNTSLQYLNDLLQDTDNVSHTVILFDDKSKRYTPELKNCVYELLTLNVAASKVSDVIKSALKLVNIVPNKLPCKTTVLDMNFQRLCLAQKQLAEVFSKESNTCLMTDETSKFGSKFMGYEASDSKGNLWVLGLREIETKSATDTLKVFKQILSDLDDASTKDSVSRDIITHITSTMSDRAATEVKFNELLESYRKEVLPLTYYNYHTFTEEEKASVGSLSNFFCGLHALVNFAEASQKSIKETEKQIFDNKSPSFDKSYTTDEPGVCRLVRTASKCFGTGSGGDEKSGCQGPFKTFIFNFLEEKKMKSVPLKAYKGSRFNILFSNACSVFFLHEKMLSYLKTVGTSNRLQSSVLFDLEVQEYLAGVKALALVSTFITCPLWCVLEAKEISMLDMNMKYLDLVNYLEEVSNSVDQFMSGSLLVFQEYVKKDAVYEYLLQPRPYDDTVQVFLNVILSTLCQLGKRLYKEHLPGGHLTHVDPVKVKATVKTSCFAESVFGQLDQLMRTKPNLSTLAAESFIMFLNNNTIEWLNCKEPQERNKLIAEASLQIRKHKVTYKERLREIEEQRRLKIQEKIRKREIAEREKLRKQLEYTNSIMTHGLWQSEDEVENMIETYTSQEEQVEALKTQINFRKKVLLQVPSDKKTFNFSKSVAGRKSRQNLSVEELKLNLKALVSQAVVKDLESNQEKHILVGKRVKHQLEVDEGGEMKKIWYTGRIISQVPSFRDWFNIIYDGDPAVYTYHRLDTDLENQDLEILI